MNMLFLLLLSGLSISSRKEKPLRGHLEWFQGPTRRGPSRSTRLGQSQARFDRRTANIYIAAGHPPPALCLNVLTEIAGLAERRQEIKRALLLLDFVIRTTR